MNNYRRVRLTDHRSANCSVRMFDNGDICFQSYATDVLYYVHSTGFLYCTGTYSQTTRRQIGWFLREYFPNFSYHDAKAAYESDCKISVNVTTFLSLVPLTPSERDLMHSAHSGCSLYPIDFKV